MSVRLILTGVICISCVIFSIQYFVTAYNYRKNGNDKKAISQKLLKLLKE